MSSGIGSRATSKPASARARARPACAPASARPVLGCATRSARRASALGACSATAVSRSREATLLQTHKESLVECLQGSSSSRFVEEPIRPGRCTIRALVDGSAPPLRGRYVGVLDERLDLDLLTELAAAAASGRSG